MYVFKILNKNLNKNRKLKKNGKICILNFYTLQTLKHRVLKRKKVI